jgi:hypothetical protein
MAAKLKIPDEFEIVSRFELVASSLKITVALGMTAPLASATVPLMFPVALCPTKDRLQNTMANRSAATVQARELKIRLDLIAADIVVILPKRCVPKPNKIVLS